jgi:membrane-associated protease RseP (regulator of RpoE activity)
LLIFGFRHPAPVDEFTSLDFKRKILGVILFILFLASFTPVPLKL